MSIKEQEYLSALCEREEAGRFLHKLDGMRAAGAAPGPTERQLRQEYIDRILAAEHAVAHLKDQLTTELRSAHGERARRIRAMLDAETSAELERALRIQPVRPGSRHVRPTPPVAAALRIHQRRLLPVALGLACVGVIALVILRFGLPSFDSLRVGLPGRSDAGGDTVSLDTGDRVAVGPGQIGPGGGQLVVNGTNGPLEGLALEVPPGAYEETVTFDLSYEPIDGFDAPEGVAVLTPLIHLDASTTEHADGLLAVTVPVDVPDGHFASLFVYDEEARTLKGLPTLEESDGSLTMLGTHLCPIIALSAPYERLVPSAEKLPVNLDDIKVTTGFKPGQDTWNLPNAGSVVIPAGYCHGMSLTSLYYYMVERGIQGSPLWEGGYDNGLPSGHGTPGFWQDDRFAIQLCSVASSLGTTGETGNVVNALESRISKLAPQYASEYPGRQFCLTALALYVTGAPQLLGLRSSSGFGHSVLCYGVDGHTLFIADPNFPDRTDLTIEFNGGILGPYESPLNVKTDDSEKKSFITYERVYFEGDISFFNLAKLQSLFSDYKAGTLDSYFPNYAISVTELDDNGKALESYPLDALAGIQSDTTRFRFELATSHGGFNGRLTVFRYGEPISIVSQDDSLDLDEQAAAILGVDVEEASEVVVAEGDSYLGFMVEEAVDGWTWGDFNWVRVSVSDQPEPMPSTIPAKLDFNSCLLEVEFSGVVKDARTGVVSERYDRMIGGSYPGKFSGNTFTATWAEEFEPGTRYRTIHRGQLTVTVDLEKKEVASFAYEDEWLYTCDGVQRYAASGTGIPLATWDMNATVVRFSAGYSGQKPVQPAITWQERLPREGANCSPGYTAGELLSAENFRVTILFSHDESA